MNRALGIDQRDANLRGPGVTVNQMIFGMKTFINHRKLIIERVQW